MKLLGISMSNGSVQKKFQSLVFYKPPLDGKRPKYFILFTGGLIMQYNMQGDKKKDMVIGAV